jgi:alkylhydroperoxidase family enzyme
VARINVCLFCIDIARSFTIKTSMNEAKVDALEQYWTSALFTDAEINIGLNIHSDML